MPIAFIEQIQRPLCGSHCLLPTWYTLSSLLFLFSIEAEYIRYSVTQPPWQLVIWVVSWPSYDQGDIGNFWKMFPWLTEGERPVKRPWISLSAFGLCHVRIWCLELLQSYCSFDGSNWYLRMVEKTYRKHYISQCHCWASKQTSYFWISCYLRKLHSKFFPT